MPITGDGARTQPDVWAFGAILFEMLTGRRAFTGRTTSDVLAAILQGAPDLSALPPETPPAIARLIRRCLERDPKARLHDIGDARLDIEDVERALRDERRVDVQAVARRPAGGVLSNGRVLGWAMLGVVVLALSVAAYIFAPAREGARQEIRLQLSPPTGMRFVSVPAVSPDGSQMVFAAVASAGGAARRSGCGRSPPPRPPSFRAPRAQATPSGRRTAVSSVSSQTAS